MSVLPWGLQIKDEHEKIFVSVMFYLFSTSSCRSPISVTLLNNREDGPAINKKIFIASMEPVYPIDGSETSASMSFVDDDGSVFLHFPGRGLDALRSERVQQSFEVRRLKYLICRVWFVLKLICIIEPEGLMLEKLLISKVNSVVMFSRIAGWIIVHTPPQAVHGFGTTPPWAMQTFDNYCLWFSPLTRHVRYLCE